MVYNERKQTDNDVIQMMHAILFGYGICLAELSEYLKYTTRNIRLYHNLRINRWRSGLKRLGIIIV